MFVDPTTRKYPNRWAAHPEEDDRFRDLETIMSAICVALDAAEDGLLPEQILHSQEVAPYLTPLRLAALMEDTAARIRRLTD